MGKHSTGVSVRDRTYYFTKYRRCFVGQRGVEWLVQNQFATSAAEATTLGQELLDAHLISHVAGDERFLNRSSAFYRFHMRKRHRRSHGGKLPSLGATAAHVWRQRTLNVRLASALELKQRLETVCERSSSMPQPYTLSAPCQ